MSARDNRAHVELSLEQIASYADALAWFEALPRLEAPAHRGMWAWVDTRSGHVLGAGPTAELARRRAALLSLEIWLSSGCEDAAREHIMPDVVGGVAVELVGHPVAIGRLLLRSNCEAEVWLTVAEVAGSEIESMAAAS
ncbi:MAG TPA: hypothetical protein PKA64_18080 [Myxococcota bacterium]|nr:hypothetical protein [Myxococcota bacterium]